MDPRIGRFLGVDPWSGRTSRPTSLHKYSYASNDPVGKIDPTGKFTSTGPLGYAVEDKVEDQYRRDHPKDLVQFGDPIIYSAHGFFLKPDIANLTLRKFAEIKPLSVSGTAKGVAQCVAVAALERLQRHLGAVGRDLLDIDGFGLEQIVQHSNFLQFPRLVTPIRQTEHWPGRARSGDDRERN